MSVTRIVQRSIRIIAALAIACATAPSVAAVWGPEVRLTNAVGHSLAPRLAAYNGALHAVWFDYLGAGPDPEVLYSRSTDNGNTWSAPVNLSANGTRPDLDPVVAADASGVYVIWNSDINSGEVYLKRSLDNGVTWQSVQQLTNATGASRVGGITTDAAGTLHVVYYDDRVGYSNVYHRQSCDHGFSWIAEQNVTVNDGVVDNEGPRLVAGQDGKLYLAFRSSRDGSPQGGWPPYQIYLLRGTPSACPSNPVWLYPAQRVTRGLPDEYSDAYSPEIAASPSGAVHVAFWDQLSGNDIGYRRLNPAGSGFGPVRHLAGLGANHPQTASTNAEAGNLGISEDNAGTLQLLFAENAGVTGSISYGRLFYRSSADAGTTWSAVTQVGTTSSAAMPKFLYARGRVHAAWTDFRDNNVGGEIYYRNRDLQQTDLIDHFYVSILNRAADATGKSAWQSELARVQGQGLDAREVFLLMSGYFFDSAEYQFRNRDNTQYATDLFATFFNRAPDSGSLSFWVQQLDGGAPRDMVRHAFAFSSDYDAYARSLLDRTDSRAGDLIVSDFYRGILNRLGENGSFEYWRAQFRAAQCAGTAQILTQADAISQQFFNSAEYANRGRDNVGYMQDLYIAMMRRYATLYELWSWANALNNNQYTREQVRSIFLNSLEFQYRVNRVFSDGCLH